MFNHNPYKPKMKRIYFFRSFQALLVFSLAFTLTNCGNLDNPLEELSGGGSGGSSVSVTSISLDQTTLSMQVGDADVTLKATVTPDNATTVTWSSDKESVATVTDGVVHAVAAGTAIITAKAGDKSASCTVTVTEPYAANEYKEGSWNSTLEKVEFTKQTAASVTAMTNTTTWDAGWYTVSGNVTITGNVTLTADAHLILQDGATLTINGLIDAYGGNGYNLYIYGQEKGDGKLNVNSIGDAISSADGYRIDIHGGEVTAETTSGNGLEIGYLAVYGGKLTATSGGDDGIRFYNTINVYGGVVEATSNATSATWYYNGILSDGGSNTKILKVYGGKVTATGNGIERDGYYGSGFACYVWSGTSGIKFYFSDNGTTWDGGTGYGIATSVGRKTDVAATQKRYAKAE
jgi:hypothetical protein